MQLERAPRCWGIRCRLSSASVAADSAATLLSRGAGQPITRPLSTTRFWPVTAREAGDAKNTTAEANSSGVVTCPSGVCAAIWSKTSSGVAEEASVVRSRPPETSVHPDPGRPEILCKGPGQRQQRRFGRGVVVIGNNRVLHEVGPDVDDPARSDLAESAHRGLDGVERCADGPAELIGEIREVDLVRRLPLLAA